MRYASMPVIRSTTAPHGVLLVADLEACCSPVTGTVLDAASAERLAAVPKALGEPTRLRLVSLIAGHEGAEACVCGLTAPVGLSEPTVSHHLKVLVEAGLLERAQRGKWAYYRLVPAALDALAGVGLPRVIDTRSRLSRRGAVFGRCRPQPIGRVALPRGNVVSAGRCNHRTSAPRPGAAPTTTVGATARRLTHRLRG